jgi:acyl-CoA thioesterase-1
MMTMTRLTRRSALAALGLLMAPPAWAQTAKSNASPVRLLLLGDSLTAGYGLPQADGFQARLAKALKSEGAAVTLIDGAVSGDTTGDAAARLDWVLSGGPVDAAVVVLGGNDGLRGLDPALMQRNLTHILDVFAAKHIPVLLSGMIAPPNLGADYAARFKGVFVTLSKRPGVINDPFFLQGLVGHPDFAQADGIHPNAAGVKIEVVRLLPLVLQLVAQVRAEQPKAPAG